jgi:ribosomal-protein-alanine N-acetyltransferase
VNVVARPDAALCATLAALQAEAYAGGAAPAYQAASIAALAAAAGGVLVVDDPARPDAFALGRVAADEGEVLALAVRPAVRRRGAGAGALAALEAALSAGGAGTVFLEVAEGNDAARALYARAGYAVAGRRRGYYPSKAAVSRADDALVMVKRLC